MIEEVKMLVHDPKSGVTAIVQNPSGALLQEPVYKRPSYHWQLALASCHRLGDQNLPLGLLILHVP